MDPIMNESSMWMNGAGGGIQMVCELGHTPVHKIFGYFRKGTKKWFTVMMVITAARTKFPLSLIASGKTEAVEESHFDDVSYHRPDHSESGWTTCDTFRRWFAWLRVVYDDGQSIWLILDCYSVHCQKVMK
jgi:hypothetical protein